MLDGNNLTSRLVNGLVNRPKTSTCSKQSEKSSFSVMFLNSLPSSSIIWYWFAISSAIARDIFALPIRS